MKLRRTIGAVVAVLAVGSAASACAGSDALREPGGCETLIRGTIGIVRPESSKLTCATVKRIIGSIQSKPQKYVVISESPHLLWKCQLFQRRPDPYCSSVRIIDDASASLSELAGPRDGVADNVRVHRLVRDRH
jgi:hypothetical protein